MEYHENIVNPIEKVFDPIYEIARLTEVPSVQS